MAVVVDEPRLRNRTHVFNDRFHAGEQLVEKLVEYKDRADTYVLSIPAGGVQVAFPIVKKLGLPLDLAVTCKLHIPWNKEAGFGALTWDGVFFLNESLVSALRLTSEDIETCVAEEREVIRRRVALFRHDRPFPDLEGRIAVIVDDGLASGYSVLATAESIRRRGARQIVVSIPTASTTAINLLKPHVDKIICLNIRSGPIFAVADAYRLWYDLEDKDVVEILRRLEF